MGIWEMTAIIVLKSLWWIVPVTGELIVIAFTEHKLRVNRERSTKMKSVVDMMIEAYIKIMGIEKWNSLSSEEQRAVIMTMVKDLNEAIDEI